MKKILISLLLLLLLVSYSKAQNSIVSTKIDTLALFPNKVLVQYKTYKNDLLTENKRGFFYHDTISVRRSRLFPGFVKKKISLTRFELHGTSKVYGKKKMYRIGEYYNGEKINMTYYDSMNVEISRQEFYEDFFMNHLDQEKGILFLPTVQ